MPVAQGGPAPLRQAVLVGLGAVMTLGTILFLVTSTDKVLGGRPSVGPDAGDPVFRPGPAAELADFIDSNGNPMALQDPTGGDRDIWLNHVGSEVDQGWYAFGVRPLTSPRTCAAQWERDRERFVDDCDGSVYPPDGEGLPQFPVTVGTDGEVSIRLGSITPSDAPTTDGTTAGNQTGGEPTATTTHEAD